MSRSFDTRHFPGAKAQHDKRTVDRDEAKLETEEAMTPPYRLLTDADIDVLHEILRNSTEYSPREIAGQAYAAGYARGIADAARVCDKAWRDAVNGRANEIDANECAAAIRALAVDGRKGEG